MYDPPENEAEYQRRYMENTQAVGFGIETGQDFACPGCAAPHFMRASLLELRKVLQQEHTCVHCHRSFVTVITEPVSGETHMELMQCGGVDLPEWLRDHIKRKPAYDPDPDGRVTV